MKRSSLTRNLILSLTGFLFINMIVPAGSGEIVLSGVYQGKDLYINNPRSSQGNQFCIRNIYLNEEIVIADKESSICRIILSHLKIGEPVSVKVEYRDDCLPVFMNPQVIRDKDSIGFGEIMIDDSGIEWKMSNVKERTLFFIEKRINQNWVILKSHENSPGSEKFDYFIPLSHDKGLNQYRIKAISSLGKTFFSGIVMFESESEKISFYPRMVSGKITLMEKQDFEILDIKGRVLMKGKGSEISVESLSPGVYYLVINERMEKFVKK
ncbi:MAG: hypothetical protein KFF73_19305 [Cyclobacteriaceae bacterium]|nr:hypothetical protein [Cyclobacteriaceae bacterium]